MPVHEADASTIANPANISAFGVACPRTTTDTSFVDGSENLNQESDQMCPQASDNTARGMSLAQEESLYRTEPANPSENDSRETNKQESEQAEERDESISIKTLQIDSTLPDVQSPDTPTSDGQGVQEHSQSSANHLQRRPSDDQLPTPSPEPPSRKSTSSTSTSKPLIERELNSKGDAKAWDFSHKPLKAKYPSSLLQTNSKYLGTQQSDRQIYNVAVTILTVDMEQATLSGYLEICGLTPDHPELTTFFTGEIIGGPDQKYNFRTKDPSWGASNKTDLTHWARFPAWRPLSPHAKHDINFIHPIDGSPWWQQEHVFMRWKEHFLVPDYKLRSIQGASFEGFYYICLNQVEGKISGIYFHSKSEK